MLKKRWLLHGFPGGPTTEIQAWSVLEPNLQKSCRKKLARVPPSLVIFRFRQITIDFAFLWFHKMAGCHFVISQNGTVPFCEITKIQNCQFWKLVKSQNGTLPFCDFTEWHSAILWNHKNAKCWDSQNYEKNFWGWTSTTSTLKIAMIRSKVVVPRWMVKKSIQPPFWRL
jgi:hypothetical protein